VKWLKRVILKYRIDSLRADIACADERRSYAQSTVDSVSLWERGAYTRLRSLRSRLALIERPEILLKEAINREIEQQGRPS
jgi:hypothetical protein